MLPHSQQKSYVSSTTQSTAQFTAVHRYQTYACVISPDQCLTVDVDATDASTSISMQEDGPGPEDWPSAGNQSVFGEKIT